MLLSVFPVPREGSEISHGPLGVLLKQSINQKTRAVKWLDQSLPPALVQQEVAAIAGLSNDNLVSFVGLAVDDGQIGLVLGFVAGVDLYHFLNDPSNQSRINADYKKTWSLQICNGLDYLHSQNIVHGDLRPRNVLLSEDYLSVKLADYGLFQLKSSARKDTDNMLYWAPELKQGKKATFLSDVFAFGLVLYEIFTATSIEAKHKTVKDIIHDTDLKDLIKRMIGSESISRPFLSKVASLLEATDGQNLRPVKNARDSACFSGNTSLETLNQEMVPKTIFTAAENGLVDVLEQYLANGADVNQQNVDGDTALHIASRNNRLEVCQLLMHNGAWPCIQNHQKQTPLDVCQTDIVHDCILSRMPPQKQLDLELQDAAVTGNLEKCAIWINKGASVNSNHFLGMTSLHVAASKGHLAVCEFLVEKGANVNAKQSVGLTPLHLAAQGGYLSVCQFLVEHNGNVHSRDKFDVTPFYYAKEEGHLDVCGYLKSICLDTNQSHPDTLLHDAARTGRLKACQFLIKNGCDPNAKNGIDQTALHLASSNSQVEICEYLLNLGAQPNATDQFDRTPLHEASANGHLEVCRLLVGKGADLEKRDADGCSVSMLAKQKHRKVYSYLIHLRKGRFPWLKTFKQYLIKQLEK